MAKGNMGLAVEGVAIAIVSCVALHLAVRVWCDRLAGLVTRSAVN